MPKDFTKYSFNGKIYCKRQLVKAVVEDYIYSNKGISLEELTNVFPSDIQQETKLKVASFDIIRKSKDISDFDNKLDFPDKISLNDGVKIRINGGWDKDNIKAFIECAKKLGYEIEEKK